MTIGTMSDKHRCDICDCGVPNMHIFKLRGRDCCNACYMIERNRLDMQGDKAV